MEIALENSDSFDCNEAFLCRIQKTGEVSLKPLTETASNVPRILHCTMSGQ